MRRYEGLIAEEIEEDLGVMIYLTDRGKETCQKLEKEVLCGPGEISPWIEAVRKEGEPRGRQGFMGFHMGGIEARGINSGPTRRRDYIDVGEVKKENWR